MKCQYFDANQCRSCSWLDHPYGEQIEMKEQWCRSVLASIPDSAWLPTQRSTQTGFRNKAKLAAGGRGGALTLGLNTINGGAQDLPNCPLYDAPMRALITDIKAWLNHLGISPYDLRTRNGELKYVVLTAGHNQCFSLRLVVRSHRWLPKLRGQVPVLRREFPEIAVATVNIHPAHSATLAGSEEIILYGEFLPVKFGDVEVHATPHSFLQTNTAVAHALYTQATRWLTALKVKRVLDLYCGVGGFALSAAHGGIVSHGIEVDAQAVRAATASAQGAGLSATFTAADAAASFTQVRSQMGQLDALIVNPPRRGIGQTLAHDINDSDVPYLLYSSCNPPSLATDLATLSNYQVVRIRAFDMFPHTPHVETMCLMTRVR